MPDQQAHQRPETTLLQDILQTAATWEQGKVGRNRTRDGTLEDWPEWAKSHPQGDQSVQLCHGRAEWKQANQRRNASNSNSNLVSLVSWNMLSDTWYRKSCEKHETTYQHTPPEYGEWKGRFPLWLEWIQTLIPDILTLQEVGYDKFEQDIFPTLCETLGYDGMIQKPKKQSAEQPCGVATFWNKHKFELVDHKVSSRSLVTKLRPTKQFQDSLPPILSILNVHLESCQSPQGAERRARQLNSALQFASPPVLLAGDFNTGADSGLQHTLRRHKWHGHALASVYEHPATAATAPVNRATFCVPQHYYSIDHIWYSHNQWKLQFVLNALSPEELQEQLGSLHAVSKGFPNAFLPSDHLPVGAIFEFTRSHAQDSTTLQGLLVERQEELSRQWQELAGQAPEKPKKGKPSPKQLEKLRAFADQVRAWKQELVDEDEIAFVTNLIKQTKSAINSPKSSN